MREAYIKSISYYLSKLAYSNDYIQRDFPEWTADKVTSKVGRNVHHIAAENETATDMAMKASEGVYGKSITDACLGWEKTERLIMEMVGK